MSAPRHFLIAAFGSLGDLHPALAVSIALVHRGHRVTLASHPHYRARVEREGVAFADMPPDFDSLGDRGALLERAMHPTRGSAFILKELLLPYLVETARRIDRTAESADALVAHPLTLAVPIVAERRRLPWFGTSLQPVTMMSARDPSRVPFVPHALVRALGPAVFRAMHALVRTASKPWMGPIDAARVEAGLVPRGEGLTLPFSDDGNLALFSRVLQTPQPDWPPGTEQPGFAFYDRPAEGPELPQDLEHFLDAGARPLVFALGSSAVYRAGSFYRESALAARTLRRRAVLVIGDDPRNAPSEPLGDDAIAVPWASYSALFPRALAIVHQGGAGTTGQALRAGRPQLVVPFSHDQPDHAARIARAGVGLELAPGGYRGARVERALARLLADPSFAERATAAARVVQSEPGAAGAAAALEAMLERARVSDRRSP